MGEVYLADDTKLERQVAIKFLRRDFSEHNDALIRFVREAKAASSLNHPNIVTIYEIGEWEGSDFIAMEYVEGLSLRELMNGRRLGLEATLNIVIQAGSALAAAHEAGIVHRDIKPENIMRRRSDDLIKVLDFGLAKQLRESGDRGPHASEDTTKGLVNTAPGFVVGTAAYMSPEQARGKQADARTDIWSLGVVLYEMISGYVPFPGETRNDMLAAILKTEPLPLKFPPSDIGYQLEHILKKALGKNCERRYQVIKDFVLDLSILRDELKNLESDAFASHSIKTAKLPLSTRDGEPFQTAGHFVRRRLYPIMIPLMILVGLAGGWYIWRGKPGPDASLLSSLTSTQITSWKSELGEADSSRPRLSPDGKFIAFVASKGQQSSIWLKQIDGGEAFTRKQGDSADASPLWSPDGGQIAYFSERGGRRGIWGEPSFGGDPNLLASLDGRGRLIHWTRDGSIIFFKMGQNLYSLGISNREITKLTNFDESVTHDFTVSPDEKQIAFSDRQNDRVDIWVSGLRGEGPIQLTDDAADDSTPIWHPDGKRIIYNSNRNGILQIYVVYLDGKQQAQLSLSDTDSYVSDISKDGTRVLYTTTKDDADLWGISTLGGKEFQVTSDSGVEFWPDISANGESIAYQAIRRLSTGGNLFNCLILVRELKRVGRVSQITPEGFNPRWSPDGKSVAFLRLQGGSHALWAASADGGDERPVSQGGIMFEGHSKLPYNRLQTQEFQWAPDARSLIYSAMRNGISNIWQSFIDGSGEKQLTNNEDKKLLFFNPIFSADAKTITWSSMTTEPLERRNWGIWVHKDGATTQTYQSNFILRLVGWSSPGVRLIVKEASTRNDTPLPTDFTLSEIDVNTGQRRVLAGLKNAYFQNVTLAPETMTLAFVARSQEGDAVQTITTANSSPKTLLSSNESRIYLSNLVFSPDGRTLYYGRQSNLQVISMVNNFK